MGIQPPQPTDPMAAPRHRPLYHPHRRAPFCSSCGLPPPPRLDPAAHRPDLLHSDLAGWHNPRRRVMTVDPILGVLALLRPEIRLIWNLGSFALLRHVQLGEDRGDE